MPLQNYITSYITCLEVYYNTGIYHKLKEIGLLKPEFSYLRPMEYYFIDDYVSQVTEFINSKINTSKIVREDGGLRDFMDLFAKLMLNFPDDINPYLNEMELLKDKFLCEFKDFFKIIYVDHNIHVAEESFYEFEIRMLDLYKSYKSLCVKLMRKEPIKTFITQMVPNVK